MSNLNMKHKYIAYKLYGLCSSPHKDIELAIEELLKADTFNCLPSSIFKELYSFPTYLSSFLKKNEYFSLKSLIPLILLDFLFHKLDENYTDIVILILDRPGKTRYEKLMEFLKHILYVTEELNWSPYYPIRMEIYKFDEEGLEELMKDSIWT